MEKPSQSAQNATSFQPDYAVSCCSAGFTVVEAVVAAAIQLTGRTISACPCLRDHPKASPAPQSSLGTGCPCHASTLHPFSCAASAGYSEGIYPCSRCTPSRSRWLDSDSYPTGLQIHSRPFLSSVAMALHKGYQRSNHQRTGLTKVCSYLPHSGCSG